MSDLNPTAFSRWSPIIGGLLVSVALVGCSATRTAYNQAPTLAYYWLDGYFDFTKAQKDAVQEGLLTWFDWHRANELPRISTLLGNLQSELAGPTTPQRVCQIYSNLQDRFRTSLTEAVPNFAALAPSLQTRQLDRLAEQYAKKNRQWKEEWLDGSPTRQLNRRTEQFVERAEMFYGRLNEQQKLGLKQALEAAGYDPAISLREMERRQKDTLQTLRQIKATPPAGELTAAQVSALLEALVERTLDSPDPQARQYSERLTLKVCAALANLHNSATAEQKNRLQDALRSYEADTLNLAQARRNP